MGRAPGRPGPERPHRRVRRRQPGLRAVVGRTRRQVSGRGLKMMRHPEVGVLAMQFETLRPLQDPDQLLVIYRAANTETQSALDRLSTRAAPLLPR
nr:hypothetical protein [Actinophytocola algeriensis]